MSKAGSIIGKVVIFILVVLLILGITAVALFFVMREKGVSVDETAVNLWFSFNELMITLDPSQIIF